MLRLWNAVVAAAALVSVVVAVPAVSCPGTRQYFDSASSTCKQCPLTMTSCSSATVAITCNRGRYLTADKQCVVARSCPTSTFADTTTQSCKKCYQVNAATCTDASATGSTSCLSGSCLQGNKCVYTNRMPAGSYCSSAGVVASCGENISKCDSTGKATTCKSGYSLTSSGACAKCTGSQTYNDKTQSCELKCADGTPGMEATQTCVLCPITGAQTCDSTGAVTQCLPTWIPYDGRCIQCSGEYSNFNADTGVCELNCPDAKYTLDVDGRATVTSPATFESTTYYGSAYCQTCAGVALHCDTQGNVVSCVPGYQHSYGVCIQCINMDSSTGGCAPYTCRDAVYTVGENGRMSAIQAYAQYPDNSMQTCVDCKEQYAVHCDATGKATECMRGYNLRNSDGKCIAECGANSVWDPASETCLSTCGDATYTAEADGTVTVTKAALRADDVYGGCTRCDDENALACDKRGATLECVPFFDLVNGGCRRCDADGYRYTYDLATGKCSGCPAGHIEWTDGERTYIPGTFAGEDGECMRCPSNADRCSAAGVPTRCYNSYLWDEECVPLGTPTTPGCVQYRLEFPSEADWSNGFTSNVDNWGTCSLYGLQ
ncbi:hypothetical protein JCM10449v2_002221 [Rhodotorula kratochvilovae]